MEWAVIIKEIFTVVLIPLLGIICKYFIEFLHTKREEAKAKINNETAIKYITMLDATITKAVMATNQTYVDTLKKQGKFDKEAQLIALNKTKEAVLATLTEEANQYLNEAIGDVENYIQLCIEAAVKEQKTVAIVTTATTTETSTPV